MVFELGHNTSLYALISCWYIVLLDAFWFKILKALCIPLSEYINTDVTLSNYVCSLEGEKEEVNELMIIVIQDKLRQRRKHLGRLRRHLAPLELHLWEKEEEEEDRASKHGMAMLRQLSLGTSLSTSTLTDCGFPPVGSDGDTADNTSEAISPEMHSRAMSR